MLNVGECDASKGSWWQLLTRWRWRCLRRTILKAPTLDMTALAYTCSERVSVLHSTTLVTPSLWSRPDYQASDAQTVRTLASAHE